jgi:hypothetical protein
MQRQGRFLRVEELETRLTPAFFHGTLPVTSGAIHLFSDQLPDGLSNSLVQFIASHFDGVQKMLPSENARYAADNPNWVLLNYKLATATGPVPYIHDGTWSSDWPAVTANESWFLHDPQGDRFFDSNWDWYLNDISNPQFQQYWINNVLGDLQENGAQGVFADSFEAGIGPGWFSQSDPRFDGTDSANPADWPNGVTWLDQLYNFSTVIENALHAGPQEYMYIPNVGPLVTSWANQNFSNLDGAFLEGFGEWGGTYDGAPSDWVLSMDRALPLSADGQVEIMEPTLFDTPDSPTGSRQREFLVGTYLLLQGNYTYLNMMVPNQGLNASYFPEYQLPLGAPLSGPATDVSQDAWDSVYRRDFQNGTVLVNPGTTAVTVTMGANYQLATGSGGGILTDADLDASGNYIGGSLSYQTVDTFTLQPGSAALLLKETTPSASSTTLSSSANPSKVGQSVTFTATVTGVPGGATPTGSVAFRDGSTVLGSGTLVNGTASFTTASLAAGSHSLTAVYGGDGNYAGSTSSALTETINPAGPAATTTTLSASSATSVYEQPLTFTAVVTGAGGTPAGKVTFLDGTKSLGAVTLSNGTATLSVATLTAGSHSVTAVYGGSSSFAGSTSAADSETVSKARTTNTLTASPSPGTAGQTVTLTAVMAVVAPGGGVPQGTITFRDGTKTLGQVRLAGGVATLQTTALTVGSHSLTAVWGGDSNYVGSTSPVVTEVVNAAPAVVAGSQAAVKSAAESVAVFAALRSRAGGSPLPEQDLDDLMSSGV